MDARDRWHELEPRLERLEQTLVHSGERLGESVAHAVHDVRDALRALRDEVCGHARSDHVTG